MSESMSVGQEFAMRWLHKNAPFPRRRKNPDLDMVAFCGDVAAAVDTYVDKKRAEFEAVLRRTICAALDDETARADIGVSARELLESECMTFIASKVAGGPAERPRRFPVNLH
ncbi:MAG: hypothetical protein F4X37_07990 [Acidimicrobiia bacterium]|nr:hypothetical protein [Acidimicrobiia bacterium]